MQKIRYVLSDNPPFAKVPGCKEIRGRVPAVPGKSTLLPDQAYSLRVVPSDYDPDRESDLINRPARVRQSAASEVAGAEPVYLAEPESEAQTLNSSGHPDPLRKYRRLVRVEDGRTYICRHDKEKNSAGIKNMNTHICVEEMLSYVGEMPETPPPRPTAYDQPIFESLASFMYSARYAAGCVGTHFAWPKQGVQFNQSLETCIHLGLPGYGLQVQSALPRPPWLEAAKQRDPDSVIKMFHGTTPFGALHILRNGFAPTSGAGAEHLEQWYGHHVACPYFAYHYETALQSYPDPYVAVSYTHLTLPTNREV